MFLHYVFNNILLISGPDWHHQRWPRLRELDLPGNLHGRQIFQELDQRQHSVIIDFLLFMEYRTKYAQLE